MIGKFVNSRSLVIALMVLVLSTACTSPNTTDRDGEGLSFVYGTNHFNGSAYQSTFIPPAVDTVYLIADNTSMLASRFTSVFYWPLTGELRPDWDEANIIVEGELEILEDGQVVETIEMTNYVIQYDALNHLETLRLHLGDDAVSARENYEALQKQYRENLFSYHQALNAYREEFQAALADLQAGKITEDQMPERPQPLQDFSLFSTDLLVGFPVELPSGTYTMQLRLPDGSIQPNSQKKLVVFSPLQEGIGYDVFAEERWSAPEKSTTEKEVIYSLPETKIYLKPFYQVQFNELYYARMNNPQDSQARQDETTWVPFEYIGDADLLINKAGRTVEVQMQDYYVRQIAGNTLGYEVILYDPQSDQEPTFRGFEMDVDAKEINLQLLDESGEVLPHSQREIRILQTRNSNWVYGLSMLPLLIGGVVIFLRRGSVKTTKMNGQEF